MQNSKDKIIYIAGFPRSGTTWFSNLFNAHPQIIYRHEILGRCFERFGSELFNALKFNDGLTPTQYQQFRQVLASADIESDRPPFFKKDSLLIANDKLHHFAWLATKVVPILRPLYRRLFTPLASRSKTFVIKETRSVINMDSIIRGIQPDYIVFLIRHPYGVIASHLKGVKANLMPLMDTESKVEWFQLHADFEYIKSLGNVSERIDNMGSAEFYAIQWRVYNDALKAMQSLFPKVIFCQYEAFLENPEAETKQLMSAIDLPYSEEVSRFISNSSSTGQKKGIVPKDSGNDFYSVYRDADFNKDKWKELLSADDLTLIDSHTRALLEKL